MSTTKITPYHFFCLRRNFQIGLQDSRVKPYPQLVMLLLRLALCAMIALIHSLPPAGSGTVSKCCDVVTVSQRTQQQQPNIGRAGFICLIISNFCQLLLHDGSARRWLYRNLQYVVIRAIGNSNCGAWDPSLRAEVFCFFYFLVTYALGLGYIVEVENTRSLHRLITSDYSTQRCTQEHIHREMRIKTQLGLH